jgi:hypothetical protein
MRELKISVATPKYYGDAEEAITAAIINSRPGMTCQAVPAIDPEQPGVELYAIDVRDTQGNWIGFITP